MLKTISIWAVLASTLVTTTPIATTETPVPEKTVQEVAQIATLNSTPLNTTPIVTAAAEAIISFEKVTVTSIAAPKPEPKPEPAPPIVEVKTETPTTDPTTQTTTSSSTSNALKSAVTTESASTPTKPVAISTGSVQAEAASQMVAYGWGADQLTCLISLWEKESNWNYKAENSSSGAYGIPQSLPGSKMASAGADWKTNPATQIKWGLGYIAERYKTPCGAWSHSVAVGWY